MAMKPDSQLVFQFVQATNGLRSETMASTVEELLAAIKAQGDHEADEKSIMLLILGEHDEDGVIDTSRYPLMYLSTFYRIQTTERAA